MLSGKRPQIYDRFRAQAQRTLETEVAWTMHVMYMDAGLFKEADEIYPDTRMDEVVQMEFALHARRTGQLKEAHGLFAKAWASVQNDPVKLHEFARTKIDLADALLSASGTYDREARRRLLQEAKPMLERVLSMEAAPHLQARSWFDLARVREGLDAPEAEVRQARDEAARLAPGENLAADDPLDDFTNLIPKAESI